MIEWKQIQLLCGKTDKVSDRWLPLWMHAMDTAYIMQMLRNHWLSEASVRAIGISDEELDNLVFLLGLLHDIGKATPLFQHTITMQRPQIRKQLEEGGWVLPKNELLKPGKTPHAMAGEAIFRYVFEMNEMECPTGVGTVIGAHHGKPQKRDDWYNSQIKGSYAINLFGENEDALWEETWDTCLRWAAHQAGYEELTSIPDLNMRSQMLLTGLLIMADWIASNTRFFPLLPFGEIPERDEIYPKRAMDAWSRIQLPEFTDLQGIKMTPELFLERFGFPPNSVQQGMIDVVQQTATPGICILEARMGIGKTEAALAAAEILKGRYGEGGIFFGLPTQATANGIFPRLLSWAEMQSENTIRSIRLAHGMAEFNEDFKALFAGEAVLDDEEKNEGVIVHDWFQGKKTALLSDFVIGTVDQMLMAALQQKHLMLRHLGLSGKVIIIDECHAYDAYMNIYLGRVLRWLGAYKVPVIVLSATLPAERRFSLIKAYTGDKTLSVDADWVKTEAYPLITWSEGKEIRQKRLKDVGNNKQIISVRYCGDEQIPGLVANAVANNACTGVIVNSVKRSQMLYQLLKERIPDAMILLYHARFVMPERIQREKEVLRKVGKDSTEKERERVIIIGTQVLEQSLDIDFDVLFTDLCPMDLLLQRSGRLHRHKGRTRARCVEKPVLYVLQTDGELAEDAKSIYGEFLLLRTKELLREKNTLILPDDIAELVQKTYNYNDSLKLSSDVYDKAKKAFLCHNGKSESKAKEYLLKEPYMKEKFSHFNSICGILDDPLINDHHAEAAVRDGEQSVEVIALREQKDGSICFLPGINDGAIIPVDHVPENELCIQMARQRLRLPPVLCKPYNIDRTISALETIFENRFEEWKESGWLCNELVLILDHNGCAELNGFQLKYTKETGLKVSKTE